MRALFVELPTFCGAEGGVDLETLERHLAWVWARGGSRSGSTSPTAAGDRGAPAPPAPAGGAILLSRSVGESQHFSVAEREAYLRHAVGVLKGRNAKLCVLSEITSNSSRLCAENCRLARRAGCDYALVRAPPKPPLIDELVWHSQCVVQFFSDVADAACLPLVLAADAPAVRDLGKGHPNIAAVLAGAHHLDWLDSGHQDWVSVLANVAPTCVANHLATRTLDQLVEDEAHVVAIYGVAQLKHCLKALRGYQKCEPANRQLAAAMRTVTDVPPPVAAYYTAELALRR